MPQPRPEFLDNEPMDLEPEERSTEPWRETGWDARKIRISSKQWSLRQAIDDIKEGAIELSADFHRPAVWTPIQRSRLVESVLLGIPLPAFYFNADREGGLQVLDGVQRLAAVNDFANNAFALEGLEYFVELQGKHWNDLEPAFRRRFHQTQLTVNILEPETPVAVKFNIFKRIHSAAAPLTSQEIRHALSRERARTLLSTLATSSAFQRATGSAFTADLGLSARELALRFLALKLDPELHSLAQASSLDAYLVAATRRLDDPAEVPDEQIQTLTAQFERAMDNAFSLFGAHSFRRWPKDSTTIFPLNRALFESWSAVLADVAPTAIAAKKDAIVEAVRTAFTHDEAYLSSLSRTTADAVKLRLSTAKTLLAEAMT